MEAMELRPEVASFLAGFYGMAELQAILRALIQPPSFTCVRVNTFKVEPALLAERLAEHLATSQTDTKYTLQHHPSMHDVVLVHHDGGPQTVDPCYPQVVVDAKCGQAVLMGSDIFVPGVIGAESNINSGDKVSVVVDVDGVMLKGDYRKLQGRGATGVAVQMKERLWNHPPLNSVLPDLMLLQHLPSVVVAHQLNPQPNSLVLDMCAAPGGKTMHIATLMKNQGRVFAFDKSRSKVKQIQELAARHGLDCVTALHKDSTKLLQISSMHGLGDNDDLHNYFKPDSFDYILLDPPCSGLGQRPRIKETISLVDVKSASQYQQKLLVVACTLLKPGGTLVYSTCTINPEENEGNVSFVLRTCPNMELVKQNAPYLGVAGLDVFGLTLAQRECVQRFSPSGPLNTIGFFIAKFTKIQGIPPITP